jgi:uncharacterized protein
MGVLEDIFGVRKPLIAMCHLAALPGRPRFDVAGGVDAIHSAAARDLEGLQSAGVDGILFCNENDLPYTTRVGAEASAAMAAVVARLSGELDRPFGVNLLWDAQASLAVARATGAKFVREVFTGVWESDMGLFAPEFGEIAAYQHAIGAGDVKVFANITPEFSKSIGGRTVAERAKSAEYLGVDALLISGPAAGVEVNMSELREAREAAQHVPVLANTGVNHQSVKDILALVDGAIVGTSMKVDGNTWNPVDPERARRLVELVAEAREQAPVA